MLHPTPFQAPFVTPTPTTPGLVGRLGVILRALGILVGYLFLKTRDARLINTLFWRLQRTRRRLERIAEDHAAGKPPRKSRPSRPGHSGPPPVVFPRREGWLLNALEHHGGIWRSQLERLLDEPEAAAFLADNPAAVRLLRPICHMLALRHPNVPPPPGRPRKPAPAPEPSPSPPPHPRGDATASKTSSPPDSAVPPPTFVEKPA